MYYVLIDWLSVYVSMLREEQIFVSDNTATAKKMRPTNVGGLDSKMEHPIQAIRNQSSRFYFVVLFLSMPITSLLEVFADLSIIKTLLLVAYAAWYFIVRMPVQSAQLTNTVFDLGWGEVKLDGRPKRKFDVDWIDQYNTSVVNGLHIAHLSLQREMCSAAATEES